jgi:hypothetical protein
MRVPTYYTKAHGERLTGEARERFERLIAALASTVVTIRGTECVKLNGSKIRVAVDDFNTILKEIRTLK